MSKLKTLQKKGKEQILNSKNIKNEKQHLYVMNPKVRFLKLIREKINKIMSSEMFTDSKNILFTYNDG